MNQNALARREPSVIAKEGLSLQTIATTTEQLSLLERLVKTTLRKGEDYGVIPGTGSKSTLLKPGAANVTAAFNCHAEPAIDTAIVDPTAGKYGFVNYEVHVDIISNLTGNVMARGYGSANSHEKKYRWRDSKPKCPKCGQETINRSKDGGFYCWQKLGGCGANFHSDEQAIAKQKVGRVENDDPLDLANTLKKMAIKRAEVDAAMRLPGVARFFTQDMEDLERGQDAETPAEAPRDAPQAKPAQSRPVAPAKVPAPAVAQTAAPQAGPANLGELFTAVWNEYRCPKPAYLLAMGRITNGKVKDDKTLAAFGLLKAYRAFVADQAAAQGTEIIDAPATTVEAELDFDAQNQDGKP